MVHGVDQPARPHRAGVDVQVVEAVAGAFVNGLLLRFDVVPGPYRELALFIVLLNLVLALFNLIPLAPLDGYKIATGTLPQQQAGALIRYERETTLALMLLILLGAMSSGRFNPLWAILGPPLRFLYELFAGFYPVF